MEISLVWAMTNSGVIGKENALPWRIPEELKYFKQITLGKAIIMGRKTFESMNQKPLPNRLNIILTQDKDYVATGCKVVHSIQEALKVAEEFSTSLEKSPLESPLKEIMVIGGSHVFKQFLPLAKRLYVTIIHYPYSGDTYFPTIEWEKWKIVSETPGEIFTTKILERVTR